MKNNLLLIAVKAFSLLFLFISCSKVQENTKYEGLNRVYVSFENDKSQLEEDKDSVLTVNVLLTKAETNDLVLEFSVLNDENSIIRLKDVPVKIPAGQLKGRFTIISNKKNILKDEALFRVGITNLPKNMILDHELLVRVSPASVFKALTEAQKTLISGYKSKFDIDLMDFIGFLPCHTKVMSPVSERLNWFASAFEKEYDVQSIITLSEKATADEPILKMTVNPLGLNEYFEWVLQRETVFNDEYWHNPNSGPNYKDIMELLNWNKENPGVFTMSLDYIKLKDIKDGKGVIEFTGIKKDVYGDDLATVPFDFLFTPWEKQKKLIAEGHTRLKELETQDGTADPNHYLMIYSVKEDAIDDKVNFILPDGKIDFVNKKMTFSFSFSHTSADGYTRIYATYEKK